MPASVEGPGPADQEPALGVLVGHSISGANLQGHPNLAGQRGLTLLRDLAGKHALLPYQATAVRLDQGGPRCHSRHPTTSGLIFATGSADDTGQEQ